MYDYRDLATLEVDLSITEELSKQVPDDVVLVSESGIKNASDIERMKSLHVDAPSIMPHAHS